jgi:hypothetical protein
MVPREQALEIGANDTGGDAELTRELRLDPAPGEVPELPQTAHDGLPPRPCLHLADGVIPSTPRTPGTGLIPTHLG